MGFINDLMDQTGGAIGGAVGNQLGYGLGNLTGFNEKLRQDQLKQQEQLMRLQYGANYALMKNSYAEQLNMWHNTNAEAQIKHLKNAGLNPALMYAKGGAGGSTGSGGSSVGGAQASDETSRQMALSNQNMMGMAMMKMKSEIAVNESIAEKNKAEAQKTGGIDTTVATTMNEKLKVEILNVKQTVKNQEAQEYLTKLESIQQEYQNEITNATKETAIDIYKQNLANAYATYEEIYSKIGKNEAETESINKLRDAQLQDIIANYTLKAADVELTDASRREINAKIALMWPTFDNELKKAEASEIQAEAAIKHIQNEINRLDFDKNALGVQTVSGIIQSFGQALIVGLMMKTAKGKPYEDKTIIRKTPGVTTIHKSGIK